MGQIFVKASRRARAHVRNAAGPYSPLLGMKDMRPKTLRRSARAASQRAALIRAARERALSMRGWGGRFGGLK